VDRSERVRITRNVNAQRVAVRSIAWLDDFSECTLKLDALKGNRIVPRVVLILFLFHGKFNRLRQRIQEDGKSELRVVEKSLDKLSFLSKNQRNDYHQRNPRSPQDKYCSPVRYVQELCYCYCDAVIHPPRFALRAHWLIVPLGEIALHHLTRKR
jgi:hypothetical protein